MRRATVARDVAARRRTDVVTIAMFGNPAEPIASLGDVWDLVHGLRSTWVRSAPQVVAFRDSSIWYVLEPEGDGGGLTICAATGDEIDRRVRRELQRQLDEAFPGREPCIPDPPRRLPTVTEIVAALSPGRTPQEIDGWLSAQKHNRVSAPGGSLWWLAIPEAAERCLDPRDAAVRAGLVVRDAHLPPIGWYGLGTSTIELRREVFDDLVALFDDDAARQRLSAESYVNSCWQSVEAHTRLTTGWMRLEAARRDVAAPILAEVLERAVNEGLADARDRARPRSSRVDDWRAAADRLDEALVAQVELLELAEASGEEPSGEPLRRLEAGLVDLIREMCAMSDLVGLLLLRE
ncbi:MAG: hypothetical protein U0R68_07215 [Candidatus Nanopelagicales bacterium]